MFGTIESVKAVAELFAPISGEVSGRNEELLEAPETTNEDPYGDAWMIKITVTNPDELADLLSAEQYRAYIDEIS